MTIKEVKDEVAKLSGPGFGCDWENWSEAMKACLNAAQWELLVNRVAHKLASESMKESYDDGFKEGQQDIIHRNLDVSTAYNLGYKHASKKAIEIITKGL